MGLMQILTGMTGGGVNPAEDWLRSKFPDLLANGAKLPPAPQGWSPPTIVATPEQQAETARMEARFPNAPGATDAPVGGAQDGPVAPQPAPRKQGGILGALKSVFMPEAGSFMYSALNNPDGLWGARGAQEEYRTNQQKTALALREAAAKAAKAERQQDFQIAGNNIVTYGADGKPVFITPPQQPQEQERLFEMWKSMPPGPEKDQLGFMLRGVQYRPDVIRNQGNAKTQTGVAVAQARGEQSRITKGTPSASASGKGGKAAKLPTGFILNP